MKTEIFTNPANGVVHFAIFVCAQVEDVYFVLGAIQRGENRVNAILYVQIRFPLMTIAQDMEVIRMLRKLLPKIDDVPVRIALSQDRHKPENVALQTESFAIRLNQALRSQF